MKEKIMPIRIKWEYKTKRLVTTSDKIVHATSRGYSPFVIVTRERRFDEKEFDGELVTKRLPVGRTLEEELERNNRMYSSWNAYMIGGEIEVDEGNYITAFYHSIQPFRLTRKIN